MSIYFQGYMNSQSKNQSHELFDYENENVLIFNT